LDGLHTGANGCLYDVIGAPVPEASTYAMMAFGFAGLGLAGLGRKARAPRAVAL
jgi:hypothetical protein